MACTAYHFAWHPAHVAPARDLRPPRAGWSRCRLAPTRRRGPVLISLGGSSVLGRKILKMIALGQTSLVIQIDHAALLHRCRETVARAQSPVPRPCRLWWRKNGSRRPVSPVAGVHPVAAVADREQHKTCGRQALRRMVARKRLAVEGTACRPLLPIVSRPPAPHRVVARSTP